MTITIIKTGHDNFHLVKWDNDVIGNTLRKRTISYIPNLTEQNLYRMATPLNKLDLWQAIEIIDTDVLEYNAAYFSGGDLVTCALLTSADCEWL